MYCYTAEVDQYVTQKWNYNGAVNHYEMDPQPKVRPHGEQNGAVGGADGSIQSGGRFLDQKVVPSRSQQNNMCSPSSSLSDFPDMSFDANDSQAPLISRNSDSSSQISGHRSPTSPVSPDISGWSQDTMVTTIDDSSGHPLGAAARATVGARGAEGGTPNPNLNNSQDAEGYEQPRYIYIHVYAWTARATCCQNLALRL